MRLWKIATKYLDIYVSLEKKLICAVNTIFDIRITQKQDGFVSWFDGNEIPIQ